jgi:Rrf2 family protein
VILSLTAEHALRAVLYVARNAGEKPVRVPEAAAALSIPRNYLSKILHTLARSGILESMRGRAGGFRLAVPADRLSLLLVIQEFDRMPEQRRCLLGWAVCSDRNACAVHHSWKTTSESVARFFRTTTIAHILQGVKADSRI